jgi:hypothetical protein
VTYYHKQKNGRDTDLAEFQRCVGEVWKDLGAICKYIAKYPPSIIAAGTTKDLNYTTTI